MKQILLAFVMSVSTIASADFSFIRDHDSLLKNETHCPGSDVRAAKNFVNMYLSFKKDFEANREPSVQIDNYGAYSTTLSYKKSECSIVRHDGCFSAYCE